MLHTKAFLSPAILISLFLSAINGQAQNKDSVRNITLKAQVFNLDGMLSKGYIHSVSDSGLFLMQSRSPVYSHMDPRALTFLPVDQIRLVKVRKKNQVANGVGYGVLAGLLIGAAAGLAGHQTPTGGGWDFGPGADALVGAGAGALAGGVIGVGLSISSRKYHVNGNRDKYNKMHNKIRTRIIRNRK